MVITAGLLSTPEAVQSKSTYCRRAATPNTDASYDAELVRRYNQGDETAFTTLMSRYRQRLFAVAFSVLKNRLDAEEVGLGGFRGDSSLSTWLHRIAFNLSRNRYWYFHRRCRQSTVSLDSTLGEESAATFSDLLATDATGPAREVLINEFDELIARCTTQLDSPQREILTMRVTLQCSYAEIAQQFGISIGTVKSRIARARDRLRALMNEACPEFNAVERRVDWFDSARHTGGIEVIRS